MKKSIPLFVLILSIFLAACSKPTVPTVAGPPPVVVPPPVEPDPAQFGTPFNNVPDRQDATIYQVNIRPFSQQGNFAGVLARLDSIKALGVNVVYLMPTYPVGIVNAINSPYCVRDYKGVNAEFGNLSELRGIVEAAHSKNMAVIFDWVANHTSFDNPWTTLHKDWYLQNGTGNIISPPGTGWNDVAQLNFTNNSMRLAMIKAMKYWVLTANIDGFRFDYTDGPPLEFWRQAVDTLRNMTSHKLLLLAEGSNTGNFTVGFDFNFGFTYFGQLKTVYNNNKSAQVTDSLNNVEYVNSSNGQQVVRYLSNHDVNGSDGTALDLFGGKKGSMGAFITCAYMKGVPMIYNGQEVATPIRLTFPFTSIKIDWSINSDVTAEYKKVIAFRNASAAVRRGSLTTYSNQNICAFTKELAGEKVLVIVNVRNIIVNYALPAGLSNSTWTDVINGGSVALGTQVSLPAYGYYILKL